MAESALLDRPAIPLAKAPMGRPATVVGFTALGDSELARLAGLGLRAGSRITKLLKTPFRDPVECLVGPQLLAIEAWLLERIQVAVE